ncbi:hypothetical protein ACFSUS_11925 [Spirosoma soli]|uniref:PorT family protein n=1 Tax=Spirosoma soli TaxID=1770529 RepID=A0ABW5M4U6_9BACT
MQELTDDQLDGLFRKSAEEFDPSFDPAAWQAMQSRLDKHDQTSPGQPSIWKNLLRWGLPVALLLVLLGSWYAYDAYERTATRGISTKKLAVRPPADQQVSNHQQHEAVNQLNHSPASADGGSKQPASEDQLVAKANKPLDDDSKPTARVENAAGKDRNVFSGADRATKRVSSAYKSAVGVDRARSSLITTRKKTSAGFNKAHYSISDRRRVQSRNKPVASKDNRVLTGFSTTNKLVNSLSFTKRRAARNLGYVSLSNETTSVSEMGADLSVTKSFPALTVGKLGIRPAKWSKPLAFAAREVTAQPDTFTRLAAHKPTYLRGLSVRLIVAPDLSGIGLRNFSRPGTNVGLLLEYRLGPRWSLQAGAIRSTKIYKAAMTDYEMPYYMNKWYVLPEGVDGQCNMIDIPINLRYDVALRPRLNGLLPSRWFVSGGITSYIMRQEDYIYDYAEPDNPHIYPDRREWHGSTGGYGFSQLNLSAGYERALSRRLSWQVEPFIKVPLKGVGYYKINLLSTGGFFSIRYKL